MITQRNETIAVKAMVYNLPKELRPGFVVARQDCGNLWYYGTYDDYRRALEVACDLENGVVLEVE